MPGTDARQYLNGDIITINPLGRYKADDNTALAAAKVLGVDWLSHRVTDLYVASGALVPKMPRYLPPTVGVYIVRPPVQQLEIRLKSIFTRLEMRT